MTSEQELRSRICDLAARADRGILCATGFLSPEEICFLEGCLSANYPHIKHMTLGGYPEAERRLIVLLPDYTCVEDVAENEFMTAIFIKRSGYEKLDHRSYMGAILGCGLERSSVGDIVLTECGAVVFMLIHAADYFLSYEQPLQRVGRDKVTLSVADPELVSSLKREYDEAVFVVASARIDSLAGEITGLSREKAKDMIDRGEVYLNYSPVRERSQVFSEGDTVSVRGYGKYIIKELNETRKGRLRVFALKYK